MDNSFFIDKSCGALLGLAVGDALGAPLEGMKPGQIATLFKKVTGYIDLKQFVRKGIKTFRAKGFYTDDTQQMLAVCDTLLTHHTITPETLSAQFKTLCSVECEYAFGVFRGSSVFFRRSMTDLINAVPWDRSFGETAGCMASVRIAPIIIYYYNSPHLITPKIIESALITHKDPIGIIAAVLYGFFLYELLGSSSDSHPDIPSILSKCEYACENAERYLASHFRFLLTQSHADGLTAVRNFIPLFISALRTKDEQKIEQCIFDYASHFSSYPLHKITVPYALTLVPLAIKTFYLNLSNYEASVYNAVNRGGDTDTHAALAGCLSGAFLGAHAIPPHLTEGLVNMRQIKLRGEALVEQHQTNFITDLFDMELKLTQYETAQLKKFEAGIKQPKAQKAKPAEYSSDPNNEPIPSKKKKLDRRKYEKEKSIKKRSRRRDKTIL